MTFLNAMYVLIISPLILLFEVVFSVINRHVSNPGFAIIGLSLLVNFLVLPLYKRADKIQEEAIAKEKAMAPVITHIKNTFKGDERFFLIQAYYRENKYRPFDSLKQTIPLLLQVPFFIAAYTFLSGLSLIKGVSFGVISDLGMPDAMLSLGALSINVLPILMTLINMVSGAIYTKGLPVKSKIQLYGIAIVFLVLLYTSPAGLVFYWTLNNLFSLVKNIVMKGVSTKTPVLKEKNNIRPQALLYFLSAIFAVSLLGFYIPSTVISSSPLEFLNYYTFATPLNYLITPTLLAFGLFVIWGGVFYFLSSASVRVIFERVMCALSCCFIINYMVFNKNYGSLSTQLKFENEVTISWKTASINLIALVVVFVIVFFVVRKITGIAKILFSTAIVAMIFMGFTNCLIIKYAYEANVLSAQNSCKAEWSLSTEGQNVIVIMMDRGLSGVVPYAMNEDPNLVRQFDGFTFYPNTISFGPHTNMGLPALSGGYEYTPERINQRVDDSLADKHNESLLVMPLIFSQNGYEVTVVDPAYAGYVWIPDVSIYDGYEGVNAYYTGSKYNELYEEVSPSLDLSIERGLFCYSLFRTSPEVLQPLVYNNGSYNLAPSDGMVNVAYQMTGASTSEGYNMDLLTSYYNAENWDDSTVIKNDNSNNFLYLTSNITHCPALVSEPDYIPAEYVDNTEYDATNSDRFVVDGVELHIRNTLQMEHYEVNMLALKELGNYFDYLRAMGVYDNTRIIIVADHGWDIGMFDECSIDLDGNPDYELTDISHMNPLFMVKDFNSTGFTVSNDFMTNADTPYMAVDGIIDNPINPFTGNEITNSYKYDGPQVVFYSNNRFLDENNDNTFKPGAWYSVQNDIMDENNWEYLGEW
ncbi:MAG: YidC/Oxa1 family membrane protein insertase [Saccharofermentans sp.]|nr:YidC/Oxa1 family membrane protein insertase [Saccharofermentans sp.]